MEYKMLGQNGKKNEIFDFRLISVLVLTPKFSGL